MKRSRGVREERTDHAKRFRRTLAGFGLTWGQKVHFSTFDGKLELQCTRNGPQNPPFCPGSLQDTFIIYSSISHQHIFQTYFAKRKISRIEHLEIWKSKNPGSLTGAQFAGVVRQRRPGFSHTPTPLIKERCHSQQHCYNFFKNLEEARATWKFLRCSFLNISSIQVATCKFPRVQFL